MAKQLLPDALWAEIAPLFPPAAPRPKGGRPRVENREALTGILFVLYTAIPWERLQVEVAGCSGMTCWRRLRAWQDARLWDEIHRHMLERLSLAGEIDWSRASVDSSSVPAKKGGDAIGPNPTDRGKRGTKRHIVVDRRGLPLAVVLTGANRHDSMALTTVVDAIQPVRQRRGRPRKRPQKLHADKGYDFDRRRKDLRKRGITPRITRRGIDSSEHLGKHRWVVERTFAWINKFRRLTIRYERHVDLYRAFLVLAAAIICFRAIDRFC
ncbi:IS5 family transposase [Xanthobacter autotrophicus]|nr:IS5 family transposase [Xanthobacter autotrophicus]MDI4655129.1 IS5 family transposase [Xanthobacter autotrophicus]